MIAEIVVLHVLAAFAVHPPVIRQESGRLSGVILPNGQMQRDRSTQHRIPEQLILTGKQASVADVSGPIGSNVRQTLALNPELQVRWFSDDSCRDYLVKYFDQNLVRIFDSEARGSYRGDICRTAILAREGGFYTDMDVEWKVPMRELVDNTTSFMSVKEKDTDLLNAVMAAEKDSDVMKAALQAIRDWYRHKEAWTNSGRWMGPATLRKGLEDVTKGACPKAKDVASLHITCGTRSFRLFEQRRLHCKPPFTEDCPRGRDVRAFDGLQWGLYEPGNNGRLVAWPRFATCDHWGCGSGGWTVAKRGISAVKSGLSSLLGLSHRN
jgi:hypothetical protein